MAAPSHRRDDDADDDDSRLFVPVVRKPAAGGRSARRTAALRAPGARSAPSARSQSSIHGAPDTTDLEGDADATSSFGSLRGRPALKVVPTLRTRQTQDVADEVKGLARERKRRRDEAESEDDDDVAEDGMGNADGAPVKHHAPADDARNRLPDVPWTDTGAITLDPSDRDLSMTRPPAVIHVAPTAPQSAEMEYHALAFVNRYAEALAVLVPNLGNHESLREGQRMKFRTPLATQPPGMGKTALGENITAILRRPREEDAAAEESIAARLRTAQCLGKRSVELVNNALRDPRDENLVMRTLLAMFPHHEATLMKLKLVKPLIVEIKRLVGPAYGLEFDRALGFSIFCAAHGLETDDDEALDAFLAQRVTAQLPTRVVKTLMALNGAPVMLVLDDITDLNRGKYVDYFASVKRDTALHRAMSMLSDELQRLHEVPGCFVYCTGRSLWLSFLALEGIGSPLIVTSTLLQPLTARDVEQALQLTLDSTGRPLADCVGVAPDLVYFFAEQVVEVTGGVGRAVQFAVRERQQECLSDSRSLTTRDEVRSAIDDLQSRIPSISGMFRVRWDGPAQAIAADEIPPGLQDPEEQVRLVRVFARLLLLDAPFASDHAISIGGQSLRLTDAAVVLGLSYAPVASTGGDAATSSAPSTSKTTSATLVRLIAGSWLCRSLETDDKITSNPAALASAQLLATMRSFGGTMRGRPFEMLCADTLCQRSLLTPGATLSTLLPHLRDSARARDVVPRLRVVALPKATTAAARLSAHMKTALLRTPGSWTGTATIHTLDLPWLLSTWLPVGSLGVPADAQSGSQDFFLRLSGGVVGFALKAASSTAGTAWADLRDELSKAPALPSDTPYSLVLWSTFLSPELQSALGSLDMGVFKTGAWYLRDGLLVPDAARSKLKFTVSSSVQELIVANPHAPLGGGLQQLLGSSLMEALRAMTEDTSGSLAHLTRWMAREVVRQKPMPPPTTSGSG